VAKADGLLVLSLQAVTIARRSVRRLGDAGEAGATGWRKATAPVNGPDGRSTTKDPPGMCRLSELSAACVAGQGRAFSIVVILSDKAGLVKRRFPRRRRAAGRRKQACLIELS
jgi:hypothetical protein